MIGPGVGYSGLDNGGEKRKHNSNAFFPLHPSTPSLVASCLKEYILSQHQFQTTTESPECLLSILSFVLPVILRGET